MTRTLVALAVLGAAGGLSGCVIPAGATATEARAELYEALDRTEELAGGSWDNRDDPTPRGCLVTWWAEGEQYPALRVSLDSSADASAEAIDRVRTTWEEWGYRVEQTLVGDVTELQGHHRGQLLIFRVSTDAMTLQGQSECRPQ